MVSLRYSLGTGLLIDLSKLIEINDYSTIT